MSTSTAINLVCHQCGITFDKPANYDKHVRVPHPIACPVAGCEAHCADARGAGRAGLARHLREAHGVTRTPEKRYVLECDLCGLKFTAQNLPRHRALAHSARCTICGAACVPGTVPNAANLRAHLEALHPGAYRPLTAQERGRLAAHKQGGGLTLDEQIAALQTRIRQRAEQGATDSQLRPVRLSFLRLLYRRWQARQVGQGV